MLIKAHHHQFLLSMCLSVYYSKTHRDQHLDSKTTWKWWVKCIFILLSEIILIMGSSTKNRMSYIQNSRRGQRRQRRLFVSVEVSVIVTFWLDEKIQGLLGCVSQSSFLTLWTMRGAAWWPLNLTWSTQRWCTLSQQIQTKVITPESLCVPVYLLSQPLILFDEKEDNRHFTLSYNTCTWMSS